MLHSCCVFSAPSRLCFVRPVHCRHTKTRCGECSVQSKCYKCSASSHVYRRHLGHFERHIFLLIVKYLVFFLHRGEMRYSDRRSYWVRKRMSLLAGDWSICLLRLAGSIAGVSCWRLQHPINQQSEAFEGNRSSHLGLIQYICRPVTLLAYPS